MDITQRFVLPADVDLVPVRELDQVTRTRFTHTETDYVVSRSLSRASSQIIGADAATLVGSFRTARTVVDAVIAYGRSTDRDPEHMLVEAWPMLRRLFDAGLLVREGTRLADAIVPGFAPGEQIAQWMVGPCVHLLADTELYQVRDDAGRFFALKLARLSHELLHASRFEHEASVLEYLAGEIAPRLVARGMIGESPYLVIDWCDGVDVEYAAAEARSLAGAERQRALMALARSVLDAYATLHERGIVHGDIHPANVLVRADGRIQLIDFAYARRLAPLAPAPPRAGVAFYTEPELTRAPDTPATIAGEQYALGALLYFLIVGAHYRDFPLERAAFERAIGDAPPLSFAERGVESWPAVEGVLGRALAKDPDARFPSVSAMAAALPMPTASVTPELTTADTLARTMLSDVIARAEHASAYRTAPTASVVSGMAGLALMLYRVSLVRESPTLLALADRWATRAAAAAAARSAAAFDDARGRLSEVRGDVSPYHTVSGVYCVQALVANAQGDSASLDETVDAYIAASSAPCTNPELMFGHAGVLVATALLVEATFGVHVAAARRLMAHGHRVFGAMWEQLDAYPRMPDCGAFARTGAAHGWVGVLYASLRWCAATSCAVPSAVGARLDELAAHGEPWGRGLRWPHTLDPTSPERRSYLSGWCNGSAGLVHLWTLAGRDELAERAAWHVWEHPSEAFGSLCCGTAGEAYALLARARDDRHWRRRAVIVAERAARSIVRDAEARDGLWYGEVGVALLAADLEAGGTGCMPLFGSEGWLTR